MMGIYEIVNWEDGKASSYIGSSVDIEHRWVQHRHKLRGGQHYNPHLQNAWNKYGEDAFAFNVLEEVHEDMLLVMEQEYLDDYFDRGHCYNLRAIAGPAGPKSEEHKRKLSEALMGHPGAKEGIPRNKETKRKIGEANAGPYPAFRHRKTGEIIPAGRNLSAACREHGLNQRAMWNVKNGNRKSHKGWTLGVLVRAPARRR